MKTARFLVFMIVVALWPASIFGQTAATAKISGVVMDPNGASVAGATVTLVDKTTNAEKTTTTNSEGSYVFAGLDPSIYEITVSARGFGKQVISDVKADVAKTVERDISLQPGNINETVTVADEASAQLQTADSSVGTVLNAQRIQRLPNITRTVTALLPLQPGVTPSGESAGARADQNVFNLDGLDVSDNVGFRGAVGTVVPVPTEGVEQFGVIVSNPNAAFGRAAGAQATIITKRGRNEFHGSLYEYHLNDNLAANSWNNNRLGLRRPELKDNQFGGTIGGPILKDKLFFFGHYEGRRRPATTPITVTVPTQSFRDGLLRFRDATGAIQTVDLRTSTLCGPAANQPCDPRGLGQNPLIANQLRLLQLPNTAGGDGLNSGSFTANIPQFLQEDYGSVRGDYQVNQNWALNARGSLYKRSVPGGGQTHLVNLKFGDLLTDRPKNLLVSLTGTINPNLVNEFRVGHAFDNFNLTNEAIVPATPGLNFPVNLLSFAEPVGVARSQALSGGNTEFLDNVTWIKGAHTFQFGGNVRRITTFHSRDDKFNILTTRIASVGLGANVAVPAAQRPRRCSATITTNCIQQADEARYNAFYATQLGIVDNINYVAVRDAGLQPLPPGTDLVTDTKFRYHEFYFADTWKIKPSLTLSYGLQYQWNTTPEEKEGRETVLVYKATKELVDPVDYLRQRKEAAENGRIFNPDLAYLPVKEAGRTGTFDVDRKNFSPRISIAWQPSFSGGILGRAFGDKRTVIRGGYALLYDRLNTVSSAVLPVVGSGFAQSLTTARPLNAAGQPFRVGVDGPIPAPPPNLPQTSPITPNKVFGFSTGFGEVLALGLDPKLKNPRNHSFDFTVQRELPGNMLLEVGYLGRLGRKLYQDTDLNAVPYFFKDSASGQTFAQAFDAIGLALRPGGSGVVANQPFFDNQLAGLGAVLGAPGLSGTQAFLALGTSAFFASGDVSLIWNLFLDGARDFLGRPTYNNRQIGGIVVRTNLGESNYHAMFVTLHKRLSDGLTFDANYTLSKSNDG
ncbi:MAG: carboxypeptidase regulatory-like domain-containing protein, partial [Pyrinomonadaceae bacterium]